MSKSFVFSTTALYSRKRFFSIIELGVSNGRTSDNDDSAKGGEGVNVIHGGNDVITGGPEHDTIRGDTGTVVIYGQKGFDTFPDISILDIIFDNTNTTAVYTTVR